MKFPPFVAAVGTTAIRDFLGLNEEVPGAEKGKGKKEVPKKGAKVSEVVEEAAFDEAVRALPRVFVDTASADANVPVDNSEFMKTELIRGFRSAGADAVEDYSPDADPLMCAAFQLISRFAPTVLSRAGCPYLWRAIYPQLPNGGPCYNAAGKYCVKAFVGGQWRKVFVSDEVPIDATGQPAVASSKCRQELWPILLAKAVYTVYTALG